jgi:hypothetical protein
VSFQERNRRIMSNFKNQIEKVNLSVFDKRHDALENTKAQYELLQGNIKKNDKETIEQLLHNECKEDNPVSFVWFLAVGTSLQLKGVKKRQYQEWVEKQYPDLQPYLLKLPPSQYKEQSGCYITTATCNNLLKGEDCYELEKFRWFRDNWLSMQADGNNLIKEYYEIAPYIVSEIDKQQDRQDIYNDIWHTYLKQCLTHLEASNFTKCKDIYSSMMDILKKRYEKK